MALRDLVTPHARRLLPQALRWRWHRARHHRDLARTHGIGGYARWARLRAVVWARSVVAQRAYVRLTPAAAAARRRSERVFVFGSGYSLNDLTPAEWRHFEEHDVFGFSGFVHQRWVRTDFHLIRGWDEGAAGLARWRASAEAYARRLEANPHFRDTVFVLQGDYGGIFAQTLVSGRLLRAGAPICWYRTAKQLDTRLSRSWRRGVAHMSGTLADTVNVAVLLGWKEIVLVGVDMYDSRYFWGPPDATLDFDERGDFQSARSVNDHAIGWNAMHNTARNGMVDVLGAWASGLAADGIRLAVYNPRSLLTRVLPRYAVPAAAPA